MRRASGPRCTSSSARKRHGARYQTICRSTPGFRNVDRALWILRKHVRPDPHPSSRASEQSARDLGSSRVTSETGTLRVPHAATPGRSDTTFGTGLSGKSVRAICAIAPLPVAGQAAKTSCAEKQSLRAHSRTSPLRRCSSKIFLFRFYRNYDLVGASRFDLRGVRVVTDVERGTRWPQVSRWTSERVWTAKSCGPGIPVLMPRSRALTSARATGAREPVPEESVYKP
jgi:hypothetical protein